MTEKIRKHSGLGSGSIFPIGIFKNSLLKNDKSWTKPSSYEVMRDFTEFDLNEVFENLWGKKDIKNYNLIKHWEKIY